MRSGHKGRTERVCNKTSHHWRTESDARKPHLMLMLALASALNMVAETPLRLAICCPTAARMQQWSTF